MKLLLTILTAALIVTSCESDTPMSPQFSRVRAGSPALNVVSYNVYWGAQVEELLTADPLQIPMVAARLWGDVQKTNFPERAAAIAKQIEFADAHVVGLQEMAVYRFEQEVVLDFLQILTDSLEARGLYYTAASKSENMDIELPMCTHATLCFPLADIRLTDYDVVLVRDDVEWENPANGNFAAVLPVDVGGQMIYKPSGWASPMSCIKSCTTARWPCTSGWKT